MKTEMGVVVIFIITPSDNWLDCIFLQLLPPTPGAPEKQLQTVLEILLRIQIRKSRFHPSSCGTSGCFGQDPVHHPLLVFVSADMFCLGLWSSVDGNSQPRGVWGGLPGSNGEGKIGQGWVPGSPPPPCLSQ